MIMMHLRNGWMGFCKNNSMVRYDNSQKGVIFMKKIKEQVGNYLNYCERDVAGYDVGEAKYFKEIYRSGENKKSGRIR